MTAGIGPISRWPQFSALKTARRWRQGASRSASQVSSRHHLLSHDAKTESLSPLSLDAFAPVKREKLLPWLNQTVEEAERQRVDNLTRQGKDSYQEPRPNMLRSGQVPDYSALQAELVPISKTLAEGEPLSALRSSQLRQRLTSDEYRCSQDRRPSPPDGRRGCVGPAHRGPLVFPPGAALSLPPDVCL